MKVLNAILNGLWYVIAMAGIVATGITGILKDKEVIHIEWKAKSEENNK
jgi:hypothetical protein